MPRDTPERSQRRRGLTDKMLASMKRKPKRYIERDPEMRGLYVRVPPDGPIVFAAVARDPFGKQVLATIGTTSDLTIGQARDRAREAIRRIKKGQPAKEEVKPKPESVAVVTANWLNRHVAKNQLRTAPELRRICARYILPYWADRDFVEIKRSDIAMLLDRIEDKHGPSMADSVLKVLRSISSWVQSRDDTYVPPFAKNMRRVSKEDRQRERVLSDDELRRIWDAAGDAGPFGRLVKLLLLTAQRRDKVRTLRWDDLSPDGGVWTIATERREKGNAGALRLPQVALDLIAAQPRLAANPFVFAGKRDGAWLFDTRLKLKLDTDSGVSGWRLHDLRRTSRSLMSRAGVLSEHAERVLGHAIGGVEGIYNRHSYFAEKADALLKLAALIERIVHQQPNNVVPLREVVS
jgi:integrase